ncbi:MAG: dienelactone hydrolase family protein [Vulcanimicrobiaceae bacterium]
MERVDIATRDGVCPAYTYKPTGTGPWHAVIVYMDGIGIRPAMLEIGEHLATYGYFVLLPDLYYRSGHYEPMDAHAVLGDPEQYKFLIENYYSKATSEGVMSDTKFFLDYLAAHPDVKKGPVATTGYCMGGRMSLVATGTFPDRIIASASYHGGNLADDKPDSPHILATKIKAHVYVAGAIEDPVFPDDMKQRLEAALTQAGVDHTVETYPAKHGFVPRDERAYTEAIAERHWQTLLGLLTRAFV